MSISAYVGLQGHGKSYGVVENVIIPALEEKREVFTNIPMNADLCLDRFGMTPIPFEIQDIIDNPNWWDEVFSPGALIVIDELWKIWPSGLRANTARFGDKAFLAEHRHLVGEDGRSTEVVLLTQDLSQIASFARNLVETTYRSVKLSKMGMDKSYRIDVFSGPVTGPSPPLSKREREIFGKFKESTYSLYKSHTKSVTGLAGDETRTDKRYSVLGKTSIKLGFVAFVVCVFAVYFGVSRLSGFYGQDDASVVLPSYSSSDLEPRPSPRPKPKPKPSLSFLSQADHIYYIGKLGLIRDSVSVTDHSFKVEFEKSYTVLTDKELFRLGYSVRVVNDCMALIDGPDFNGYALCRSREEKKGWMEGMVTEPVADS